MEVKIDNTWRTALSRQWEEPYFKNLTDFVRERYRNPAITVYPPARKIFAAFDQCPFNMVKVVIIGQDPYHGLIRQTVFASLLTAEYRCLLRY